MPNRHTARTNRRAAHESTRGVHESTRERARINALACTNRHRSMVHLPRFAVILMERA